MFPVRLHLSLAAEKRYLAAPAKPGNTHVRLERNKRGYQGQDIAYLPTRYGGSKGACTRVASLNPLARFPAGKIFWCGICRTTVFARPGDSRLKRFTCFHGRLRHVR